MNFRAMTAYILFSTTLFLILWDIVAARYGGVEATISRVTYEWADQYPGLAFAAGGLIGHLFFSQTLTAK